MRATTPKAGALGTATATAATAATPATTPAPAARVVRHHREMRGWHRAGQRLRLRLRHEGGVAPLLKPQRLEHESVVLRSAGLTGASEGASAGLRERRGGTGFLHPVPQRSKPESRCGRWGTQRSATMIRRV
jgi:hypothetical protein